MERLLFFFVLFCSPSFAADLPVNWFEAGKEIEVPFIGLNGRWELRYEHRILASGMIDAAQGIAKAKVKIPPLKPGLQMRAKMFINGEQNSEALIVSPDPFEDRKTWFDQHPIALYDPAKTTTEILEREEIPFKRLRSFVDIKAVERGVVIIGEGTNFDREKGLAELLFDYAAKEGIVYVAASDGRIPLHFPTPIDSLSMVKQPKHLFPDSPAFFRAKGYTWTLQALRNQVIIVREFDEHPEVDGTTVVDIRFQSKGRIVFDCYPVFNTWEGWIASRWYFKSLVETLTNERN